MTPGKPETTRRAGARMAAASALLIGLLAMGGCSSDSPAAGNADAAPGDFPDVNQVPTERPLPPTADELESVTEGLVADREAARYARQGTRRAAQEIDAPGAETAVGSTIGVAPSAPTATVASSDPDTVVPSMTRVAPGTVMNAPPGMEAAAAAPSAGMAPGTGTIVVDSSGARQTAAYVPDAGMGVDGPRPITEYNATGVGVSSKVGVIYFASSSAGLDGNDMAVIRDIAAYQRQYGGVLRVIGHSSSRTADMNPAQHQVVNLQVSARRAQAVAQALMNAGVAPSQIFVGAVADEQKEYQEVMPSGEAFNRRTEVFLDY